MMTMKEKPPSGTPISSNVIHCFSVKVIFTLFMLAFSHTFSLPVKFDIDDELQEEDSSTAANMYRNKEKLQNNVKVILLWTNKFVPPFPNFEDKQKAFVRNNCNNVNCYVTDNRKFFGDNLKRFDAIAFNGRELKTSTKDLPKERYDHQRYIFVMQESPEYYPICEKIYDNFFNWTYTYRLDSDIQYPYFKIKDMNDNTVGPKPDIEWTYGPKLDYEMEAIWRKKKKAAAWIVSNCSPKNKRMILAKKIYKELSKANLVLDVYSPCNFPFKTLNCPTSNMTHCWELIQRDYYFYLAFENSNDIDYVTEKVLYPLNYTTIPIVYGGADYSRFMPPFSYLDTSKLSVESLVSKMISIIKSKTLFMKYFRWRSSYKYENADKNNICALCSALHNPEMMRTIKSYDNFRKWWNRRTISCASENKNNSIIIKSNNGNKQISSDNYQINYVHFYKWTDKPLEPVFVKEPEVELNWKPRGYDDCIEKPNMWTKLMCKFYGMMTGEFQSIFLQHSEKPRA